VGAVRTWVTLVVQYMGMRPRVLSRISRLNSLRMGWNQGTRSVGFKREVWSVPRRGDLLGS
jgi:hypothetical protein